LDISTHSIIPARDGLISLKVKVMPDTINSTFRFCDRYIDIMILLLIN